MAALPACKHDVNWEKEAVHMLKRPHGPLMQLHKSDTQQFLGVLSVPFLRTLCCKPLWIRCAAGSRSPLWVFFLPWKMKRDVRKPSVSLIPSIAWLRSLNICNQSSVWPPSGVPCLLGVCLGAVWVLGSVAWFCFPPSEEWRLSSESEEKPPCPLRHRSLEIFILSFAARKKKRRVKSGASTAESSPWNAKIKKKIKNSPQIYFIFLNNWWWQSPPLKTLSSSALQEASSFEAISPITTAWRQQTPRLNHLGLIFLESF